MPKIILTIFLIALNMYILYRYGDMFFKQFIAGKIMPYPEEICLVIVMIFRDKSVTY